MKTLIEFIWIVVISIAITLTANAQFDNTFVVPEVRLEGPRAGFTYIYAKPGSLLAERMDDMELNPFITQFGWQFERRFFTLEDGTSGLVEAVLLIGGMEQSKLLPSGSFLVG